MTKKRSKKPRPLLRVAKELFHLADEAIQLAQAYAGNDSDTAKEMEMRLEQLGDEASAAEATAQKRRVKPFVLVTVAGGVASCFCPRGVEWDIIDWDEFECRRVTRDELDLLRRKARWVKNRDDQLFLLGQIDELDDREVAEDLEEMTLAEQADKAERHSK